MNKDELKQWAESNNITNRIIDTFKGLLQNYELDDPAEYFEIMNGVDITNLRYKCSHCLP